MNAYPIYKSTEYKWLGDIPAHWEWLFLSQTCHSQEIKNVDGSESNVLSLSYGRIIRKKDINFGLVPKDYKGYQVVENGNIILRLTDLQNDHISLRTGLVCERGIITSAYTCLVPSQNAEYLQLLLHSYDVQKYFYGLGGGVRQSIGYKDIKYTMIPLPSRDEQDHIVRWVNWQISRISDYTRTKKREIECLQELKKAIISEAVTQGLDPKAKMKDSGVKWLGNVPEHWDIETIKRHFTIKKDIAGKEGYDVLSITQKGLKVKNIESNEGQMAQNYSSYQFVHPGDFAMNHMDLITGFIDYSSVFGVTSPDYRVFALNDEKRNSPYYFLYVFQNCYYRRIFYAFGRGAAEKGRWRLPKENFYSFQIPLPPREDQDRIVAYLDKKCAAIDMVIAKLTREIELVGEYKASITSDAVTGKIDLRNTEIPDFAMDDEPINDTEEGTENEDD